MADLPTEGLWLNLAELGQHRGTSSQAVGKRVRRLERLGLLQTKRGPNNTRLVNVAAFEIAIATTGDAVATANGGGKLLSSPAEEDDGAPRDPVLAREQARKTAFQADLAGLELDRRRGQLLTTDEVRQGVTEAAEIIARSYETIASRLDDVLAVVARDGKVAGRALLRDLGRDAALALTQALERRAAELEIAT